MCMNAQKHTLILYYHLKKIPTLQLKLHLRFLRAFREVMMVWWYDIPVCLITEERRKKQKAEKILVSIMPESIKFFCVGRDVLPECTLIIDANN